MIFLSRTLNNNLSCYNNEKNILIKPYKKQEVEIVLRGHCGTHIDFPLHYIKNGKSLKNYSAIDFVFEKVFVVPFPGELIHIAKDTDFIIFKTSQKRDCDDYALNNIGIDGQTAQYLVENFSKLRGIGIDSISINAYQNKAEGRKAHKILLSAGVLIVEDMNLVDLNTPIEKLIVAPLQVENADGVPVTVIAQTGYEAIFFDWDGVITDSVNIKTDAYVDMFRIFGQEIQDKVKAHHSQNGGMSRFLKFKLYYKEFLGMDIDETKIQELSQEFSDLVMGKVAASDFIDGAVETIREQYAKGTKLFVVTGAPTGEIKEIAKLKGLYDYFIEFCGSPTRKEVHTADLIQRYALTPQKCLFIGDSMADYTAARANNVNFLGVKIPSCETKFPYGTEIKARVEI